MVRTDRAFKHPPCLTRVGHGGRPWGVVVDKTPEEDPALRRTPGDQGSELVPCSVPSV